MEWIETTLLTQSKPRLNSVQRQLLIDSDSKEALSDGRTTLELCMIKVGMSKKLQLVEN